MSQNTNSQDENFTGAEISREEHTAPTDDTLGKESPIVYHTDKELNPDDRKQGLIYEHLSAVAAIIGIDLHYKNTLGDIAGIYLHTLDQTVLLMSQDLPIGCSVTTSESQNIMLARAIAQQITIVDLGTNLGDIVWSQGDDCLTEKIMPVAGHKKSTELVTA